MKLDGKLLKPEESLNDEIKNQDFEKTMYLTYAFAWLVSLIALWLYQITI